LTADLASSSFSSYVSDANNLRTSTDLKVRQLKTQKPKHINQNASPSTSTSYRSWKCSRTFPGFSLWKGCTTCDHW